MMNITTPTCMVCNKNSVVQLTEEELFNLENEQQPIQVALSHKTANFRELLITGTHSKCWDKMLNEK